MISVEHHNPLDQQSYEMRLQQLEVAIERQRETLAQIDSRLGAQGGSLDSLKAYLTLMMASWHSEIGIRIDEISRQIESTATDNEGWLILHSHVASANEGLARQIKECSPALTELETRICLLMAMELTMGEIAATLNLPRITVESTCANIRAKLDRSSDPGRRQLMTVA